MNVGLHVKLTSDNLSAIDRVVKMAYRTGNIYKFNDSKRWCSSSIHDAHIGMANIIARKAILKITSHIKE